MNVNIDLHNVNVMISESPDFVRLIDKLDGSSKALESQEFAELLRVFIKYNAPEIINTFRDRTDCS